MIKTDILIIGAGQAGLSTGYHLRKSGFNFLLVEKNPRLGDNWRKRYDSLLLFTPRSMSSLPGLALEGDPRGYASRDEFAAYLEDYARQFNLPILLNTGMEKLTKVNHRFFATSSQGEVIESRVVVLASGGFQKPILPIPAKGISAAVFQLSMENYRNPNQLPAGKVVVVGDGASGRDIARELSRSHTVYLATGKPRRLMPEKLLGISLWWWLKQFGILNAPSNSLIGKKLRQMDSFPDRGVSLQALRQRGVRIMPRLVQAEGDSITFADRASIRVNAIIWAAGYRDDSDWVAIPQAKDGIGNFLHHQGISPVENMYLVGRPWQTSRASALICGVEKDSEKIVNQIMMEHTLRVRRAAARIPSPSGNPEPMARKDEIPVIASSNQDP